MNCRKNNLASRSAKLVAESAMPIAQISSYNSLSYKIHFLHDPGKRLMYSYSHKVHKIINKLLTKDYFDCTFLHFVQNYYLENGKKAN